MKIVQDDWLFIEEIDKRFPDKNILKSFQDFIALDPFDRPKAAQDKIDHLPRAGYVARGIPAEEAETVGQHTRAMKDVADEITKFSVGKLKEIIDIHDMSEAIVRDFMPTDNINTNEKHRLEELAINVIFEAHPEKIETWKEYGKSLRGKMAKDIDKLQMWDQSEIYKKQYPELQTNGVSNFQDLIDNVVSRDLKEYGSINTVLLYYARKNPQPL